MICLQEVKKYCKEYWKIENYQEAMADETQSWDCHHRFEIDYNMSVLDLQALGFYFNRPFYELIFLTHGEHSSLHNKDKIVSNETKQKLSDVNKGRFVGENNPNYGNHLSEEVKQRIRECNIGNQNHKKFYISKEELYDLYIVQGLHILQIAKMYGCGQWTICNKLKEFNIKKYKKS